MRVNKRFRLLVLGIAVVSIFTLSIVFAVVSQTLTISTDVEVMPQAALNVEFDDRYLHTYADNGAEVISEPTVEGTTISGLSVRLVPGSSVRSSFGAVNNSENAEVILRDISPYVYDSSDNPVYDIKLVHYLGNDTEKEVSLWPLTELDNEAAIEYLLETFTEEELSELGYIFEDNPGDPAEFYAPNIYNFLQYFPTVDVHCTYDNDPIIFHFDPRTSESIFYDDEASVLQSVNENNYDFNRTQEFYMRISLDSDIDVQLPEGYAIKFTNLQLKFNYAQVGSYSDVIEENNSEECDPC